MKKLPKCNAYHIVSQVDHTIKDTIYGGWDLVKEKVPSGHYAKRADGFSAPERAAKFQNKPKQEKLRKWQKAIKSMDESQEISAAIWMLQEIGLPCVASMVKEKLGQ